MHALLYTQSTTIKSKKKKLFSFEYTLKLLFLHPAEKRAHHFAHVHFYNLKDAHWHVMTWLHDKFAHWTEAEPSFFFFFFLLVGFSHSIPNMQSCKKEGKRKVKEGEKKNPNCIPPKDLVENINLFEYKLCK